MASSIGDPQVRNLGTIGGSLAHSDPSGDMGAAVLALRGGVVAVGPSGRRSISIDDFLVDTFTTALSEDELIMEISVPIPPGSRSGGAYMKLERKAGDFATVGVAAQVSLDGSKDGRCSCAGIGLTGLASKSLRASRAEKCLTGKTMTNDVIAEASSAAASESSPTDDPLRGSADYKRAMARVFTARAIEAAVARAKGAKA